MSVIPVEVIVSQGSSEVRESVSVLVQDGCFQERSSVGPCCLAIANGAHTFGIAFVNHEALA